MTKCAICENELSKYSSDPHCDSAEHIFPNSVGGQKTVSGFICRECNSKAGETWDATLAEQMQPFCLMFGISRDRGAVAPMRVTTMEGERVTLKNDGSLSYSKPDFDKRQRADGSIEYSIMARDEPELRRMLEGVKRKHPELDIEAALTDAKPGEKYLDGDLHFSLQFGGQEGGRSMIKTCLAFAHTRGIVWQNCGPATDYIRDLNAKACFGYFSSRDLVSDRQSGVPLHCVALRADPATGLILAYAEYFGVVRIVACLGEGYSGSLIEAAYAFDPRKGDELQVQVSLNFDREAIEAIYDYKHDNRQAVEAAVASVLAPALKAQVDNERNRVVERAVDKAFNDCGAAPGEPLTREHLQKISRSIAESVAPFMLHQMRGIKGPTDN